MPTEPPKFLDPDEPPGFVGKALDLANSHAGSTRWLFELYLVCAIVEALQTIATILNEMRKDHRG